MTCSCDCHTGPYAACSVPGGCGTTGCGRTSVRSAIPTDERCMVPRKREPDRHHLALDGLRVCAGHRKGLAFDLLDLPGMWERLAERHSARTGAHSEVRAKGHAGLSLSDPVSRLRGDIYTSLAGWARVVHEERGFTLPPDDVHSIARYLLGINAANLDWCCAQTWVDEFADDLDRLHREAFGLLYPRGRRRFEVGDCIEVTACDVASRVEQRCPGRMLATLTDQDDDLPAFLWCSDCGLEVTADRWITYGRRVHKALEAV